MYLLGNICVTSSCTTFNLVVSSLSFDSDNNVVTWLITDSFNSDLRQTKLYSTTVDPQNESVLLWIYNVKPDQMILNDTYSFPWIQEYAYSFCKRILGQAYSKFAQIVGPQGGTSLNGPSLMQEAQTEMERLEYELVNYVDNGTPLTWVTG